MPTAQRDAIRLHACAFNGRDLDHIALEAEPDTPCFCDGEWVGEGPVAVREALQREFNLEANLIGRVGRLDDERVIIEMAGGEGRWEPRGAVRLVDDGAGRIREVRIDHAPSIVSGLVPEPDV